MQPGSDEALRDLSRFGSRFTDRRGCDGEPPECQRHRYLSGIVHALGHEYGHRIEIHDEIHQIRDELTGWFLFQTDGREEQACTTHPLWSTLYLWAVAQDHYQRQTGSRRRDQSEPHAARCLQALFALVDDADHREAGGREFPGPSVMAAIDGDTGAKADEYVRSIFDVIEKWPVLASLAGTTHTARYDLPAACSKATHQEVLTKRGHAHRNCGAYQKAETEYKECLKSAKNLGDRRGEATSLDNLGVLALALDNHMEAGGYLQESLEIIQRIGHLGVEKAESLLERLPEDD